MKRKPRTRMGLDVERRQIANLEAWEAIERFLHAGLLKGRGVRALLTQYAPTPAHARAVLLGLRVIEGGETK